MKVIIRLSILICCIWLVSCGSRKHAVNSTTVAAEEQTVVVAPSQGNNQPAEAKRQEEECITAKLRLELSASGRSTTVGGALRMKRDDVIQLSVITFGILEVARIEATPDYFMVVDKMGRQYVKASYSEVPFLRNSDIDFKTLQTYFWDEQTSNHSGWVRSDFVNIGSRSLPTKHTITIPTGKKTIKAGLTLSNLRSDSEWEKRTQIPSRYKEVTVDEAISRIMDLVR